MGASAEEVGDVPAGEGTEVSEVKASHQEGFPSSCPRDCSIDDSELIEMKENISTCELNAAEGEFSVLTSATADHHAECGTSGEGMVTRYPRGDLEALRFADVDEQQRKWHQVYQGLDSGVSQEYDKLAEDGQKKMNRNQEQPRRWERRKEPICGELFVEQMGEAFGASDLSGLLHGRNWNEESWAAEEVEACDEYDSDDEHGSFQHLAFAVQGEPDFESGPPQDGLEYLRRVRWEAAQMPRVRVAKVDKSKWSDKQTPYMPKIPEIAKCPDNLRPSRIWVDQFLTEFSDLRKVFSELESSANCELAMAAVDGGTGGGDPEGLEDRKTYPTLSSILRMLPVGRAAKLRSHVRILETTGSLSRDECLWIFALCAAVDSPFDAEMSSCMRRLLRRSSALLARKTDPADEEVARLNILIAISGRFFGQSED